MIRALAEPDRAALDAFLGAHAASSMYLRSNVSAAGLVDGTGLFQGHYVGRFDGESLTDVGAHYRNGNVILQAPTAAAEIAQAVVAATGRAVAGVIGPWDQATAGLDALNLRERARTLQPEDLFEIKLDRIRAPDAMAIGAVTTRRARADDLDVLIPWRVEYHIETLGAPPIVATATAAKRDVEDIVARGEYWVAIHDGDIVACSGFNARLPDMVQVGGVFTPKHLRGEGFARAAVAGSLIDARAEGASRAILFTETRNAPAQRVYKALGFERIGDYGLILLND